MSYIVLVEVYSDFHIIENTFLTFYKVENYKNK